MRFSMKRNINFNRNAKKRDDKPKKKRKQTMEILNDLLIYNVYYITKDSLLIAQFDMHVISGRFFKLF